MASDFSTITLEAVTSQIIKYMGKIKTFYLVNFSKKFTFQIPFRRFCSTEIRK